MTSPVKRTLLLVLALLALGAPIANAASQPEYRTCTKAPKVNKKHTGGYNNNTCTDPNAAGEGKYALGAVPAPYPFAAAGKAGAFDYHTPTGVVWQVTCARDGVKGVITGPATGTEAIVFESCKARNQATDGKRLECPGHLTATVETVLVELLPGGAPGVLVYPGFAKAFTCEGVTFGQMVGFEVGAVEDLGKGPVAGFAVNPATGEPTLREFFDFEEHEAFTASLESDVSGSPTLDVGLQIALPLGPKKEVVVKVAHP